MVDSNSNRQSSLIAKEPKRDEMYQKTQHTVNNVHPLQGTRGCFFFYLQPRLWKCRWVKDLKDEGGYEWRKRASPQDHLNILMEEGAGAQVSPWPLWRKRGETIQKFWKHLSKLLGFLLVSNWLVNLDGTAMLEMTYERHFARRAGCNEMLGGMKCAAAPNCWGVESFYRNIEYYLV